MKRFKLLNCSRISISWAVYENSLSAPSPTGNALNSPSCSVVLVDESAGADSQLKVLIGHAVQKIEVLSSSEVADPPQLFQQAISEISERNVTERKKAVMSLLEENRLPVKEIDQALHIEGVVSIRPPYGIDDCVSTSPIILTRIHNILSQIQ